MTPYVLQHPDFALGNFINLTPAIRWLAERLPYSSGKRVPVYFSTNYVRECFLNCPFIEILKERPDYDPIFSSAITNPDNDRPDYQHIFNVITGTQWTAAYHTCVDQPVMPQFDISAELVMINGSGSQADEYTRKKDVGESLYRFASEYISGRINICACGSYDDLSRAPYMVRLAHWGRWGDIRNSLAQMSAARCIIANDSGLAHAAGAMNKPLLVLWKDTPRERCKNAGMLTEYSYENHEENIRTFLEKYL